MVNHTYSDFQSYADIELLSARACDIEIKRLGMEDAVTKMALLSGVLTAIGDMYNEFDANSAEKFYITADLVFGAVAELREIEIDTMFKIMRHKMNVI